MTERVTLAYLLAGIAVAITGAVLGAVSSVPKEIAFALVTGGFALVPGGAATRAGARSTDAPPSQEPPTGV